MPAFAIVIFYLAIAAVKPLYISGAIFSTSSKSNMWLELYGIKPYYNIV